MINYGKTIEPCLKIAKTKGAQELKRKKKENEHKKME
jgi:hypothetical protein